MTVKQKQAMLVVLGYDIKVDGIWGPKSAGATLDFQLTHDELTKDGLFGDKTEAVARRDIFYGMPTAAPDQDVPDAKPEQPMPDVPPTETPVDEPTNAEDDFWAGIRYWKREEFKCRCGEYHAPYCDGYPVEPDHTLVELLDDIRAHFGRPGHRSSGVRCKQHNADSGGVSNSRHLSGKAMDFYIEGVSGNALRARAAADPRCRYSYVIEGNYVHVDVY